MSKREVEVLEQLAQKQISVAKASKKLKCSLVGAYIKGFIYLRNKYGK
jgi:hypothetical protein